MGFTLKPVTGKQLVGRTTLVEEVVRELMDKRSDTDYAFYGRRRVGKTSLLREIEVQLRREQDVIPIYISLWQIFPFTLQCFLEQVIAAVMAGFGERLSLQQSAVELMKTPLTVLKKILETIQVRATVKEHLELTLGFKFQAQIDYGKLFHDAFTLPEILAQETNTKVVLILDEFPSLLELKGGLALIRTLRTIHEQQKKTVLCIAGSIRKHMETVALAETAPFYKQFMVKEVPPLSREDVKKIIEIFGKDYGINITERGVTRLYSSTQGLPFYVQFIGKLAAEKHLNALDEKEITTLITIFLEEEGTTLFLELMQSFSPREQGILKAITQGKEVASVISEAIEESPNVVSTYLSQLLDKGVIEKIERGRYKIVDIMFKEWVK